MSVRLPIALTIAGLLAAPLCAQPRRAAARPGGPAAKAARRTVIDRWSQMSREEKQKFIERMPAERKDQIRKGLDRFSELTPQERQDLRGRYENFQQLPREQQDRARRLFRQFNNLPEERRPLLRGELADLRSLPDPERRARINSEEFRNKYTLAEQQLLQDLSQLAEQAARAPASGETAAK